MRLRLAEAPGLTLDEGFNVATGVYLVRALKTNGLGSLHPATIKDVYGSSTYNPDHPPLGRWALGLVHEWLSRSELPFLEVDARPASAIAFALTVLLAGWFVQRWFGPLAGTLAALSVAILPRQFAHAHLASLETFIGLAYAACVLVAADRCRPRERSSGYAAFALAGVFFGLALLTKIQAVFLAPAVGLWAWSQWGLKRAVPRVALFAAVGFVLFFAGWPWLWLDPVNHLREYFARTTERQTLYCYYLGHRWADRDVPWHYPWVMFAVTVPMGLHFFASFVFRRPGVGVPVVEQAPQVIETAQADAGGWTWRVDPRIQLILWAIVIPLVVFSIPGIRVYDGERLFGVVFPLWGAIAGVGAASLLTQHAKRGLIVCVIAVLFVFSTAGHFLLNPFQLSFYNVLVGGPWGADALGFERSYWMEGLTESFQRDVVANVPRGHRVDVAPVLHRSYLPHLQLVSPVLLSGAIKLAAYDDKQPGGSKYVIKFHRRADSWAPLEPPPEGTKILAEVKRAGVPMVTLYQLP
jgi:4-amino-4-deoxy-L-arabinose transferase-like glycosyltransferase